MPPPGREHLITVGDGVNFQALRGLRTAHAGHVFQEAFREWSPMLAISATISRQKPAMAGLVAAAAGSKVVLRCSVLVL
jgi:hypothetical protein